MRFRSWLVCTIACLATQPAGAAVKLHALFSDGMVLQREIRVPVWGSADEGEQVTVQLQEQKVSATAKDGKWLMLMMLTPQRHWDELCTAIERQDLRESFPLMKWIDDGTIVSFPDRRLKIGDACFPAR